MTMHHVLAAALAAVLVSDAAVAPDLTRLVTQADVERVTGAKFAGGTQPMPEQIMFQQAGGDLQISVDLEAREGDGSVRTWEATLKRMQPATTIETVPGVGVDAIYYSTRADMGALSADFNAPRVQMRVSVSGAKTPAQAKQIVTDLAKAVAPRVGK